MGCLGGACVPWGRGQGCTRAEGASGAAARHILPRSSAAPSGARARPPPVPLQALADDPEVAQMQRDHPQFAQLLADLTSAHPQDDWLLVELGLQLKQRKGVCAYYLVVAAKGPGAVPEAVLRDFCRREGGDWYEFGLWVCDDDGEDNDEYLSSDDDDA